MVVGGGMGEQRVVVQSEFSVQFCPNLNNIQSLNIKWPHGGWTKLESANIFLC